MIGGRAARHTINITMPKSNGTPKPPRAIGSTQSLSAFVKSICDIMRRSNCASALQYVPELTWILFLRILDAQETAEQEKAEAVGRPFTPALRAPYRWQDWAAPYNERNFEFAPEGKRAGWKRAELEAGKIGDSSSTKNCCRTCTVWTCCRMVARILRRRPNNASSGAL